MKKNFAILITGHLRTFETNIKYLKKIFKNFDVYVYTLDTREHFKILRSLAIKNFELVNDKEINMKEFTRYNELFNNPRSVNIDSQLPRENSGWLKQLKDYSDSINWFNDIVKKEYDFIVRYRPDLKPVKTKKVRFVENEFNCFQQNIYNNHINDKFFLSNKKIMTLFMNNMFHALKDENIYKYKNEVFNVEEFIFSFLKVNSLKINLLDKNKLKFKKNVNGKLLSAGFNQYHSKSIKHKFFD